MSVSRAGLLIVTLGLSGVAATAQAPRARLEGTVLSVANGRPASGVIVSIPAANRLVTTDDSGAFAFDSLVPGVAGVYVAVLGRSSSLYSFNLRAGKTKRIEVLVDSGAVELAPIVVRAAQLEGRWGMSGFYARQHMGFGHFITRDQIERIHYASLEQALSSLGVFYMCGENGCGPTSHGGRCRMSFYVDGVPGFGDEIGSLPAATIAGIEVYKTGFDTPWEFAGSVTGIPNRGIFNGGRMGSCGAVVVWTRDWRSDLPEDW